MNKGIKFRAYPNSEQQNLINQTINANLNMYKNDHLRMYTFDY